MPCITWPTNAWVWYRTSSESPLDWSLESLTELDLVCASLLADGPLTGQRLDLWWKLVGSYTGEVVIRAYGGAWVSHDHAPEHLPSRLWASQDSLRLANLILTGEPFKSLASFARTLPTIAERSQRAPGD